MVNFRGSTVSCMTNHDSVSLSLEYTWLASTSLALSLEMLSSSALA
jgi:hypothetical protein